MRVCSAEVFSARVVSDEVFSEFSSAEEVCSAEVSPASQLRRGVFSEVRSVHKVCCYLLGRAVGTSIGRDSPGGLFGDLKP